MAIYLKDDLLGRAREYASGTTPMAYWLELLSENAPEKHPIMSRENRAVIFQGQLFSGKPNLVSSRLCPCCLAGENEEKKKRKRMAANIMKLTTEPIVRCYPCFEASHDQKIENMAPVVDRRGRTTGMDVDDITKNKFLVLSQYGTGYHMMTVDRHLIGTDVDHSIGNAYERSERPVAKTMLLMSATRPLTIPGDDLFNNLPQNQRGQTLFRHFDSARVDAMFQ